MKKFLQTFTQLLIVVCCFSCGKHSKTEHAEDNTKPVSQNVSASYGPSTITRTIKQDRNGDIWFASWEGIIRYDGNSFTNITRDVSLSRFFSVLEDRKGHFWFASIGSGVYYYNGRTFQNFTIDDGLASNSVTYLYEDKKGNIWFGTEGGASCYNGKIFQNFTTKDGLPHDDVNAIIEDNSGKIWFGTRGDACFYDGETITTITRNNGKKFKNVRAIIEDKKGAIWIGGNDGLWRYDGNKYTQYKQAFTGCVYEDKKGNIWTSSESETTQGWTLSYYEEESLFNANAPEVEVITQEGIFFGILEDFEDNIWVGNLNGIYRYNGNTFNDFKSVN